MINQNELVQIIHNVSIFIFKINAFQTNHTNNICILFNLIILINNLQYE